MPDSPNSNILTTVLDRLVQVGWIERYTSDVNYHINIRFSDAGIHALSELKRNLAPVIDLPDVQLEAFCGCCKPSLIDPSLSQPRKDEEKKRSRDTATPISRPVYMIFHSFNLNPVIDAHPR